MLLYNASKKQSFCSFGLELDLSASLQGSERWRSRSAIWTQARLHSYRNDLTTSRGTGRGTTGGTRTKRIPNTVCFQQNIFSGSRKRGRNLAITHKKYLHYPQSISRNLPALLYGQLLLLTNMSSKCTFLLYRIIFPWLLGEKDTAFCLFLSSLAHPEVDFTGKTAFASTTSSPPVKEMSYSKST